MALGPFNWTESFRHKSFLSPVVDGIIVGFGLDSYRLAVESLIKDNKKEEAQLILDLKKELGFKDKYFEKKINYLFGYTDEVDITISEKSILNFHLAHITNPNFVFEPKESTNKIIWRYLSSSNLLTSFKEVDTNDLENNYLILSKSSYYLCIIKCFVFISSFLKFF